MTGRFAPSPSGRIHLGNIFSFLLAWLSCRKQNGRMILRMEDLDEVRCPRKYGEALAEDLRWPGLDWDGEPVYQSMRKNVYQQALERLKSNPETEIYPCFCTRAELHTASAPHRDDGQVIYPGTCCGLSATEIAERYKYRRPALRLRAPDREFAFTDRLRGIYRENLARDCGDFLLCRSDGVFAYQLAVVVDDSEMGITEVVRGADLLSSTPRQLFLYEALGSPPPDFIHIPVLLSPDGRRLSKRDADTSLDILKTRYTAEELLGKLGQLAGFHSSGKAASARELLTEFDWDLIPREDIRLTGQLATLLP